MKFDNFPGDITPSAAVVEAFDTAVLFSAAGVSSSVSPIDQYVENTNRLAKMYLSEPVRSAYTNELGVVLLLGHVSAVESYLRGLIRGLVQTDDLVKKLVAPFQVTYIAALYHQKELLPEALLEGVSFSSPANVSNTLRDFCGISGMGGGNFPQSLKSIFEKFGRICQLRHCCVHRFGLLGADNARKLGIDTHMEFLEKPVTLSLDSLEEISSILQKFVASINSYVYRDVMERSVLFSPAIAQADEKYKKSWHFEFLLDEMRFSQYYDLFARTKVEPISESLWEQYDCFMIWAKGCIAQDAKERMAKANKIRGDARVALAQNESRGLKAREWSNVDLEVPVSDNITDAKNRLPVMDDTEVKIK